MGAGLPAKRPEQTTQFSPTWRKDRLPTAITVVPERQQERPFRPDDEDLPWFHPLPRHITRGYRSPCTG
ncbi:hypothetical protein DA83_20470 [Pseudomonas sp. 250J]|nr:hypothetical protein DA83_20470 [Pseudomonas sp. 250J]